jgi:hypothetical protein
LNGLQNQLNDKEDSESAESELEELLVELECMLTDEEIHKHKDFIHHNIARVRRHLSYLDTL